MILKVVCVALDWVGYVMLCCVLFFCFVVYYVLNLPYFCGFFQAGMAASSFSTSTSGKSEPIEVVSGHCSIGLEKLCKVAMVSSGGVSGSTGTAQMLLRDGLPMYRVDQQTMQVHDTHYT